VACFWTRSVGDSSGDGQRRVLPDGCIDIIWIGDAEAGIAGPSTRAFVPPIPAGTTLVGVRFLPGMAPSLLGLPARDLLDLDLPLRAVWGRAAVDLSERVASARTADARLAIAAAGLRDRLAVAQAPDRLVGAAIGRLVQQPRAQVRDLSLSLDLSERQLLRRFESSVGYGPKTLQGILRMHRWLRLARQVRSGPAPLAALAAAAGYADQAHLSREVARLAGVTPTVLLSDL
jgi:AraC-like DNA-binding protein